MQRQSTRVNTQLAMHANPARVLVADPQALFLEGLRALLEPDFTVVGQVADGEALVSEAVRLRPALVLLDLNLPGRTGWEFLRDMSLAKAGDPPVVVTTATTVNPTRLRELHVAGYLPKPFAMETLVATVERFVGARP